MMNGRKKNARKKVSPEHKDRKHLKLTQNKFQDAPSTLRSPNGSHSEFQVQYLAVILCSLNKELDV